MKHREKLAENFTNSTKLRYMLTQNIAKMCKWPPFFYTRRAPYLLRTKVRQTRNWSQIRAERLVAFGGVLLSEVQQRFPKFSKYSVW